MPQRNLILIVDDDPNVVAMLQLRLERAGYEVGNCNDAAQAVIQAKGLRPRLIITDINMPNWGTGVDAYHGIRAVPSLRETPLIFLTAIEPMEASKMVPKDERTRLLFKPVDWALLQTALSELVDGPEKGAGALPPKTEIMPPAAPRRSLILLVDDDPHVVAMLQLRLERAGFGVASCDDAAQAVIQAKGLRPRLIITDISMPNWGTGVDAYRGIRGVPSLRETPLIFLTALEAADAFNMVPKDDRTRLLFKPVDWALLQVAISELLGEARSL